MGPGGQTGVALVMEGWVWLWWAVRERLVLMMMMKMMMMVMVMVQACVQAVALLVAGKLVV
jgi:hypothetical protein